MPIQRAGKSAHTECTRRNGVQPLQDAGVNYVPRADITSNSEEKGTPDVLLRQKRPKKSLRNPKNALSWRNQPRKSVLFSPPPFSLFSKVSDHDPAMVSHSPRKLDSATP